MASLTESSLTCNNNNNDKDNHRCKKIYLCIEKKVIINA